MQNFINLSLFQGINILVALIITPILFQRLGETQFGYVNLALSIVLTLGIAVNYGFNVNIPKRVALIIEDKANQSILFSEVIFTRLIIAFALAMILLLLIYPFGQFPVYNHILALSLIFLLGEAMFPMIVLQGYDRLILLAVSNGIIKVSYLIGVFLVIRSPEDAKWVNFIFGSVTLLMNTSLLVLIYFKYRLKLVAVGFKQVSDRIKDNFQFFSYSFATHIMVNGGFLILNNFVSDVELGRYALAQRVGILLRSIPAFITQSILQNAARLFDQDIEEFDKYLNKAYRIGLLFTFCIGLLLCVFANWIITVLAGEAIPYSANVLRIISFIPFGAMLNVSNMIRIIVTEKKHLLSKAVWINTAITIPLCVVSISIFGGFGLAATLLFIEFTNFIIHKYLLYKDLNKESLIV